MPSRSVEPINNFETNGRRSRDAAETRPSRGARGNPIGRYDGRKARLLPTGLGQAVPSMNAKTATVSVVDPFDNGVSRIQATVSINVDILEKERAHTRISEAAYLTGRILQEKFERASHLGGSNWMGTSKQDPMMQQELRVLSAIISAEDVTKTLARIRSRLGHIDARLIQRVLGDRMSFGQCAEVTGKNGERGASYIGARFREALEDLAQAWTAKGALQPAPDDKHALAADGMVDRQRRSMVKGITTERRAEEAREAGRRAALERRVNPARR